MATAVPVPALARPLPLNATSRHGYGVFLLLLADTVALSAAAAAGAAFWSYFKSAPVESHGALIAAVVAAIAGYAGQGLYSPVGMNGAEHLRRMVTTTTLVYLALTAALFLTKEGAAQSRGAVLCAWALSLVACPAMRALAGPALSRRSWWGSPVVLIGGGEAAQRLISLFRSRPELGLRPVAIVPTDESANECYGLGLPVYGSIEDLDPGTASRIRHTAVVTPGHANSPLLDACSRTFSKVLVIPDWNAAPTLWIAPKDLGGTLGLELRHNLLMPFDTLLKRVVDIAVVVSAAALALPIIAVSAACIYAVSRQWPFYVQKRRSCNGREITLYKLRTMYPNADMMLLQFLDASPEARSEWDRFYKLKNDPRVLPGIGRFLRRTSLDELPQLWNILKGEMSLVGPRPVSPEEIKRYGSSFEIVGRVKPGLTGLWQVSGRNELSYEERVQLDSYYVRNWSIWLDVTIIAQTVKVVLCRHGAY